MSNYPPGSDLWALIDQLWGQSADALRADLASDDDGKGAELLAFRQKYIVGAIKRTLYAKVAEVVSLEDFYDPNDADDTQAFARALLYLKDKGGELQLTRPEYQVSAELTVDGPGIHIVGRGAGTTWDNLQNAATRIVGTHALGSVFRVKWENCSFDNILVDADGARLLAAANYTPENFNAGIRFEADDVPPPEGDVFTQTLRRVYVRNQPNDGIIMIGRTYQSLLETVFCVGNRGHGLCVDGGRRTGRTNQQVAGVITLLNVYCMRNKGHGWAFGNPDDDGASLLSCVRVLSLNSESSNNDVDASIRYAPYDAFVRGDNCVFIASAFGGKNAAGTVQHHGGVAVGGRDNKFISCRYLDTTRPARVMAFPGSTTTGTEFDGMAIRNAQLMQPVTTDAGTINTRVRIKDTISSTAAYDSAARDGIEYDYGKECYKHGTMKASDFSSGTQKTINDDAVSTLTFEFNSGSSFAFGIIAVGANTENAGPAIFAFRVGSNPYCKMIAGDAALTEATTGPLDGSGGTDGKFTLSAADDGKLYFQNRTANPRVYSFTVMSVNGGRLAPGQ